MSQLNQRKIKWTKCDSNGRQVSQHDCDHHFFIILKNNYNHSRKPAQLKRLLKNEHFNA